MALSPFRTSRAALALALIVSLAKPPVLLAPPAPLWWAQRGVTNGAAADDFAAANLGQLKHIAVKARVELNANLPGGAGTAIDGLVASWSQPHPQRDDFAAATIGQVKAVAKLFYDRLIHVGYTQSYPWTSSTADDDDFAVANLGQLKHVFSFDISADTDGDGLTDLKEMFYGTDPNNPDTDGDGLSDAEEIQRGTNPLSSDSDGDGLSDGEEISRGTNPNATDSDGDGLDDSAEVAFGSDPLRVDTDDDGLTDYEEMVEQTEPDNPDTDNDGVFDGKDGWPTEAFLKPRRLPVRRYAILSLVTGNEIGPFLLNDDGDVVYARPTPPPPGGGSPGTIDICYLKSGAPQPQILHNNNFVENANLSEICTPIGIAADGEIHGTWPRGETLPANGQWVERRNFKWKPGDPSITYSGDHFRIRPDRHFEFGTVLKESHGDTVGNEFTIKKVTVWGRPLGIGTVSALRYDMLRSASIAAPGIQNVSIPDYAQEAFPWAKDNFIEANRPLPRDQLQTVTWAHGKVLMNDLEDFLVEYRGFNPTGPNTPVPANAGLQAGLYLHRAGDPASELVSLTTGIDKFVQMNNHRQILAEDFVVGNDGGGSWSVATAPRFKTSKPTHRRVWAHFNDGLEAIGICQETGTSNLDHLVMINDHDYLLNDLIDADWRVKATYGINRHGAILATVRRVREANGADIQPDQQVNVMAILLPFDIEGYKRGTINSPGVVVSKGTGEYGQETVMMENADSESAANSTSSDYTLTGNLNDYRKGHDDDLVKVVLRWPIDIKLNGARLELKHIGMEVDPTKTTDAQKFTESGASRLKFYKPDGTRLTDADLVVENLGSPGSSYLAQILATGDLPLFIEGAENFGFLGTSDAKMKLLGGAMLKYELTYNGTTSRARLLVYRGGFLRFLQPAGPAGINEPGTVGTFEFWDGKGRVRHRFGGFTNEFQEDETHYGTRLAAWPARSGKMRNGSQGGLVGGRYNVEGANGHTPPGWWWQRERTPLTGNQLSTWRGTGNNRYLKQGNYCRWIQDDATDPAQRYTQTFRYRPNNTHDAQIGSPSPNEISFKFDMFPIGPSTAQNRKGIQIHPDGQKDGTAGCIGIQNYDHCRQVLQSLRRYHGLKVKVQVPQP